MANKVEGKPCERCGGTERYAKKGRMFGPCVACTLARSKSLVAYYETRDKRQYDFNYRVNILVISARGRSKKQRLPFDIDTEFMKGLWKKQNGCCAVSGRPFTFEYNLKGGPHRDGPSIDKIIPELGYVKDNVRFVTYQVNTALSNFGDDELMSLLEDIKKFKESK